MLTGSSTYGEMRRELLAMVRRLCKRSPLVIPGLRGKYERAKFKGVGYVYHDTVVCGQPVTIEYDVRNKTFNLSVLIMDACRRMVLSSVFFDGNMYLEVLSGHAVERYVQRAVKHDESAEVTDEEFREMANAFVRQMGEAHTLLWDKVTGAYFRNYEGGAFVAEIDRAEKVVLYKTFLPVSKMKTNQSLTNGKARMSTKDLNRRYDDCAKKRNGEMGSLLALGMIDKLERNILCG